MTRAEAASGGALRAWPGAVDAACVPAELAGFRTVFSGFHHFRPAAARRVLQDAVERGEGVGVFEATERSVLAVALMCLTPLVVLCVTPMVRPFRWSRLLWTYLVPVIPFVVWFDGVVSCLRTYTPGELLGLAEGLGGEGYRWEVGYERAKGSPVPLTYLIGRPIAAEGRRDGE